LAGVEFAGVGSDEVGDFALVGVEVVVNGGGQTVDRALGVDLQVELEFVVFSRRQCCVGLERKYGFGGVRSEGRGLGGPERVGEFDDAEVLSLRQVQMIEFAGQMHERIQHTST
jgi:hypothetical protein